MQFEANLQVFLKITHLFKKKRYFLGIKVFIREMTVEKRQEIMGENDAPRPPGCLENDTILWYNFFFLYVHHFYNDFMFFCVKS